MALEALEGTRLNPEVVGSQPDNKLSRAVTRTKGKMNRRGLEPLNSEFQIPGQIRTECRTQRGWKSWALSLLLANPSASPGSEACTRTLSSSLPRSLSWQSPEMLVQKQRGHRTSMLLAPAANKVQLQAF